jgi:hypothetical protein
MASTGTGSRGKDPRFQLNGAVTNPQITKTSSSKTETSRCSRKYFNILTFNIINGFAGNHALQLSFGLLKTIKSNIGSEEKVLPINNIFILDKFTKRLIHDGRMSISIQDVTDVQREIVSQVELFKRYNMTQSIVDDICGRITKKFAKKFISLYENLPENLRNFYYCSFILSVLVESEKNISLEIKLRDIIKEKLNNLIQLESR